MAHEVSYKKRRIRRSAGVELLYGQVFLFVSVWLCHSHLQLTLFSVKSTSFAFTKMFVLAGYGRTE